MYVAVGWVFGFILGFGYGCLGLLVSCGVDIIYAEVGRVWDLGGFVDF